MIPQQTLEIQGYWNVECWISWMFTDKIYYPQICPCPVSNVETIQSPNTTPASTSIVTLLYKMPRYRDVLPIVRSWTFETIVHMYNPKAFRIMLVLQGLHHLPRQVERFWDAWEPRGVGGCLVKHGISFSYKLCHDLAHPIPITETLPLLSWC